ncbi:MAG TPA: hypothetical protein VGB99_01830 [Acidobacteriota bacterium]
MERFTKADLQRLIGPQDGPCVSIFLPTHRAGAAVRQDPIRLKNRLREAEEKLVQSGQRAPEARELLEPARLLLDPSDFWAHQSDGLALFLTAGIFHRYRLALPFDELTVVGDRFHLKPLFPLLSGDGRFFVLALSQNQVRLYEATRTSIDPLEIEEVPGSLAEALPFDAPQRQLQFHTGAPGGAGGRAAMFHGHGPGEEDNKERLLRFFQQIDAGLHPLLREERVPLVLAGVDYYFPIYRQASGYPLVLKQGIAGNPEELSAEELQAQAWKLVEPYFRQEQDDALARYRQQAGTGLASSDLRLVVPAAHHGRVDTLWVARGMQLWGGFDPESGALRLDDRERAGGEDLLDSACIQTFLHGGTVFNLPADELPASAPAAALFRY